jgi:hypothetical protein
MRRALTRTALATTILAAALIAPGNAAASSRRAVRAPAPLSGDTAPADIASSYGSGHFGQWQIDQWGLPAYNYTDDEPTDPDAAQAELAGGRQAQHQLGNDRIKGAAFNDGYTQFWDQDLLSQWANLYQPSDRHYAGGYGYLNVDGKVGSTLYLDHPTDEQFQRSFGVGYYRKQITFEGVHVREDTYAPFGNDPVLLDDVTLTNTTSGPLTTSWFEYWDVNPFDQSLNDDTNRGLSIPSWNAASNTLSVAQFGGDARDTSPLSIFAASLSGAPVDWDTSVSSFFGNGSRAVPAEVAGDRLGKSLALPNLPGHPGNTLFAFRAPVTLAPGQSVTLRYVYGMAHPAQIAGLVAKYRADAGAENGSERAWKTYLPRADFGAKYRWVARELQWDAYLLRSSTVYDERCGEHTITQGGYYEYGDGYNLGTRSWLHYELPILYSDPDLAREIIDYSLKFQPPGGAAAAQLPYGTGPLCERIDLGTSNDLDFWLLNAAAEYGLATRDLAFFHSKVPFYGGLTSTTVWDHLKLAFEHAQTYLGPHGDYLMGTTGDWSDFSTELEQMTESTLVLAQLTYAYPRLAQLADLYGDTAFAAQLRAAAAKNMAALRAQWTAQGWYSRGYSGVKQVGSGVIFEEPQPWAILAGAPTRAQATTLVANIHRYLDGDGAPGGPTKIGSTIVPGLDDPGVTEHGPLPDAGPITLPEPFGTLLPNSPLAGADEWPGGVWFDPNGWLTWALGSLQGEVPGAVADAWSEYLRNTLATHATAFPDHWAGTISVDDVCYGYYSAHPDQCGNGLSTSYDGQITEQPTWMVMDAIDLAGVTPVSDGYDVTPHLPMTRFSLRDGDVGVARAPGVLRGYVTPVAAGRLVMHVAPPPGAGPRARVQAYAGGRPVRSRRAGGLIVFTLPTVAGRPADWAVVKR